MSDAPRISDYKDLEWVDRVGICYLDVIADDEAEHNLNLGDILTILFYISRNARDELMCILIDVLNKFQETCPDYISELPSLAIFYEKSEIQTRKKLADILNPIIREHKEQVKTYLKTIDQKDFQQAFEGLCLMASYVMTAKRIDNPDVIRQTLHLIESKLPPA